MTSFCDVFPDEPDCGVDDTPTTDDTSPTQPGPTEPTDDNTNTGGDDTEADPEGKTEVEEEIVTQVVQIDVGPIERAAQIGALMAWRANSAAIGHLVYIGISMFMGGLASLYVFRYSTGATFYDRYLPSGHLDENRFKWGDMIQSYGGMGLWGLAFLSSLFAPIGSVMVDFNMFVWVWGIVVTGSIVNISAFFLKYLAFEQTYSFNNLAVQNNILIDFAVQASVQAAAFVILLIYYDDWNYAMWCALSEEDQEAKIAELMADINEMEADMTTETEVVAEEPAAEEAAPAEGEIAADETAAPAEGETETV